MEKVKVTYLMVFFLIGLNFVIIFNVTAQVNYTANSTIPGYNSIFYYGSNPGYYPPFSDKQIADIGLAAGVHTLRPALYDWFLAQYGLSIRTAEFVYYGGTLGMRDLTLFLSDPSPAHQETIAYSPCTITSKLFKNMYAPIWDGGTNGTSVNDTNYFARYVYDVVRNYGTYVKFYEIWNEPDFTYNTSIAHAEVGTPGNWWQNNPNPCDLTNTRAPIFQYIRLLRIAYEVIKTYKPSAYVTTGGIGYESYLDALLRNTDNPVDGSVTSAYPNKGGAYFDVLSFHSYPQYILRYWSNANGGGFVYSRHSDAGVDSVLSFKRSLEQILKNRGYDGVTYPKKFSIITETNIPRRIYPGGDHIGSSAAQRNFIVKTMIKAQMEGIRQVYTFTMGDSKDSATSVADGFDMMGLYKNLNTASPGNAQLSPTGIAHKTLSTQLYGLQYDYPKTLQLNLLNSQSIVGAVFTKFAGASIYTLWAKTKTDRSESAWAMYTFPAALSVTGFITLEWNHSVTNVTTTTLGRTITLTGSPVFVSLIQQSSVPGIPTLLESESTTSTLEVSPNPFQTSFSVHYVHPTKEKGSIQILDSHGKIVQTLDAMETAQQGSLTITLPEQEYPAGIYFLEFRTSSNRKVVKLIKME